jgi:PAS domain S-box-containing protein
MLSSPASILERVSDGVITLDSEWRYTYVNARAGEILGREPVTLLGRRIWTEFPEAMGQPFHLACERAVREQGPVHLESYVAQWDRWLECRIYPSREGLSILFTDVTERKKAEERLRESEERFHGLSESAPIGIFLIDAEGRCTYSNPRWTAISGLSAEESRGYGWSRAIHPDDRDRVVRHWQRDGPAASDVRQSFRVLRPDGAVRTVDALTTTLHSDGGQAIGRVGIVEDVTERRKAEEAFQKKEQQLAAAQQIAHVGSWE